jgi:hypothetical protein
MQSIRIVLLGILVMLVGFALWVIPWSFWYNPMIVQPLHLTDNSLAQTIQLLAFVFIFGGLFVGLVGCIPKSPQVIP